MEAQEAVEELFPPRDATAGFVARFASLKVLSSLIAGFRIGPGAEQQRRLAAQLQAELLADADTIVFDRSDQWPPDIGSDLSLRQIIRWVSGAELDKARQR